MMLLWPVRGVCLIFYLQLSTSYVIQPLIERDIEDAEQPFHNHHTKSLTDSSLTNHPSHREKTTDNQDVRRDSSNSFAFEIVENFSDGIAANTKRQKRRSVDLIPDVEPGFRGVLITNLREPANEGSGSETTSEIAISPTDNAKQVQRDILNELIASQRSEAVETSQFPYPYEEIGVEEPSSHNVAGVLAEKYSYSQNVPVLSDGSANARNFAPVYMCKLINDINEPDIHKSYPDREVLKLNSSQFHGVLILGEEEAFPTVNTELIHTRVTRQAEATDYQLGLDSGFTPSTVSDGSGEKIDIKTIEPEYEIDLETVDTGDVTDTLSYGPLPPTAEPQILDLEPSDQWNISGDGKLNTETVKDPEQQVHLGNEVVFEGSGEASEIIVKPPLSPPAEPQVALPTANNELINTRVTRQAETTDYQHGLENEFTSFTVSDGSGEVIDNNSIEPEYRNGLENGPTGEATGTISDVPLPPAAEPQIQDLEFSDSLDGSGDQLKIERVKDPEHQIDLGNVVTFEGSGKTLDIVEPMLAPPTDPQIQDIEYVDPWNGSGDIADNLNTEAVKDPEHQVDLENAVTFDGSGEIPKTIAEPLLPPLTEHQIQDLEASDPWIRNDDGLNTETISKVEDHVENMVTSEGSGETSESIVKLPPVEPQIQNSQSRSNGQVVNQTINLQIEHGSGDVSNTEIVDESNSVSIASIQGIPSNNQQGPSINEQEENQHSDEQRDERPSSRGRPNEQRGGGHPNNAERPWGSSPHASQTENMTIDDVQSSNRGNRHRRNAIKPEPGSSQTEGSGYASKIGIINEFDFAVSSSHDRPSNNRRTDDRPVSSHGNNDQRDGRFNESLIEFNTERPRENRHDLQTRIMTRIDDLQARRRRNRLNTAQSETTNPPIDPGSGSLFITEVTGQSDFSITSVQGMPINYEQRGDRFLSRGQREDGRLSNEQEERSRGNEQRNERPRSNERGPIDLRPRGDRPHESQTIRSEGSGYEE